MFRRPIVVYGVLFVVGIGPKLLFGHGRLPTFELAIAKGKLHEPTTCLLHTDGGALFSI